MQEICALHPTSKDIFSFHANLNLGMLAELRKGEVRRPVSDCCSGEQVGEASGRSAELQHGEVDPDPERRIRRDEGHTVFGEAELLPAVPEQCVPAFKAERCYSGYFWWPEKPLVIAWECDQKFYPLRKALNQLGVGTHRPDRTHWRLQ